MVDNETQIWLGKMFTEYDKKINKLREDLHACQTEVAVVRGENQRLATSVTQLQREIEHTQNVVANQENRNE